MATVTADYTSWLQQPGQEWTTGTKYSANTPNNQGYYCSKVILDMTTNGAYKMYSQACYVDVYAGNTKVATASWTGGSSEKSNKTVTIPENAARIGQQLHYTMTQSGIKNAIMERVTVSRIKPAISTYSTVQSQSAASGNTITLNIKVGSWNYIYEGTQNLSVYVGSSSDGTGRVWAVSGISGTATLTQQRLLDLGFTSGQTLYFFFTESVVRDGTTTYAANQTVSRAQFVFIINNDNTVKIFNGSAWVDSIPFVFNGSTWVQCIPYVFNGSSWVECSTS